MTPTLYLRLQMGSSEELVSFIDVCVCIDAAVASRPGNRHLDKSAPLEHYLYESLEVKGREFKQAHSNILSRD